MHTFTRLGAPATTARTRWMFGFQRRFVRMCECEMLCPKLGPLPQTSQLAATVTPDRRARAAAQGSGDVLKNGLGEARHRPGNLLRVADAFGRLKSGLLVLGALA